MTLKRSFTALALVFVCACKKDRPPPPPPPPPSVPAETPKADPAAAAPAAAVDAADDSAEPLAWAIHSGDGRSTLRQKPAAPGKCFLECTAGDGSVAWSSTGADCFGEKSDRKFLSNDCLRTVVIIPSPSRAQAWRKTQVMRVYKKERLDYPVMGIAVLKDEKLIKASPSWLKGCYGLAGDPPQYSADGSAVEYETIDGKKASVPLVAER